jgi:sugar lactone lactonase YvrE
MEHYKNKNINRLCGDKPEPDRHARRMVAVKRGFLLAAIVACTLGGAAAAPRDDLAAAQIHMRDGAQAIAKGDYAQASRNYGDALKIAPQHPTAIYRLAVANASLGNSGRALALLRRLAAMGLQMPASFDASFAALKGDREFAELRKDMALNTAPLCACVTVFDGPRKPVIAEGIAFDQRGQRLLVASVYRRRIVTIANGVMKDLGATLPAGLSPFSLTLDPGRNLVWVSAASLAQSHDATPAERGHSALLAYSLRDGALKASVAGPPNTDLGDAALATDGTVYVTDSRSGGVYRLKVGRSKLEPVTTGLSSAQGVTVSPDNHTALVADYALGLIRLDLATGELRPIAVPDTVTTLGIDGLAPLADGSFVATQNGIAPPRVVHFRLSPDWSHVTRFDVIARNAPPISDPSLLTASGKDIYVVGISQWASFDGDKTEPVRPLPGFRIVRLAL